MLRDLLPIAVEQSSTFHPSKVSEIVLLSPGQMNVARELRMIFILLL